MLATTFVPAAARRSVRNLLRALLIVFLAGTILGCSRDPNTKKLEAFRRGTARFTQGAYREASIYFRNALQTDPQYTPARYALAQCYLKLHIWPEAYRELSLTIEQQPSNISARVDLGNLFLAARDFAHAREQADWVLTKEPASTDARVLRANIFAAEDNLPAALEEMEAAAGSAPELSRLYWNLGVLQRRAGRPAEAEASLRRAVELDSRSVPALLGLGGYYQSQRRWDEAEAQYRLAIQADAGAAEPRVALAKLFLKTGRRGDAEKEVVNARHALATNPGGFHILGDFYLTVGELDRALDEFAALSREHPLDLDVKQTHIRLLMARGLLEQATRLNNEFLKQNPNNADALISRGEILNLLERYQDAIPVFERVVQMDQDCAIAHYDLGVSLNALGNLPRAESEWREAVRLRPDLVPAQHALAQLALLKGDLGELERAAEFLIQAQPFSPEGYLFRATARTKRGDFAAAEQDLNHAIELAPQSPTGYTRLATLRLAQARIPEAEALFDRSLEQDPAFTEAMEGLAGIHLKQRSFAQGILLVQKQIELAPRCARYYFLLAEFFIGERNLPEAAAALEHAVALDPKSLDAILLLGYVRLATGQLEQALDNYHRAQAQAPRDLRAYLALGGIEEMRGNWQAAQGIYERALQAVPDAPDAARRLAALLLDHNGNVDVALSWAQVARRGLPASDLTADTLGWAYYRKGAYRSAVGLLQEAAQKQPDNAAYHYHLGLAYSKANQLGEAQAHLSRALQLDPKHPFAGEARRQIKSFSGS